MLSAPAVAVKDLPLTVVRVDPNRFQIRRQMNPEAIERLAESLRAGDVLPPVTVVSIDGEFWLADGHHRREAYVKCGSKTMPCQIVEGDERAVIIRAIQGNALHGESLSRADRQRAVLMLIATLKAAREPIVQAEIADLVKVPRTTLGRWIREMEDTESEEPIDHTRDEPEPEDDEDQDEDDDREMYREKSTAPDLEPSAQVKLARACEAGYLHAEACIQSLKDLERSIGRMCNDELFFRVKEVHASVVDKLDWCKRVLEQRRPYQICSVCNGDKCDACSFKGFMTYETARSYEQDKANRK